jgi:hypothetical protein
MTTAALVLLLATLAGSATAARPGFSARVDNPWFPLAPGTRFVSVGIRDGQPARDVVTVTNRTVTIDGAPCRAVEDLLYLRGRLRERTTDWYSQDSRGSVWYFGERTAELDARGRLTSTEGTWRSGVNGAQAGIFMPARPLVGRSFRQEFYKGHAEDHVKIVAVLGNAAVTTHEWTPLEPGVLDSKTYVRGVGTVLELTLRGGDERLQLVSVTRR